MAGAGDQLNGFRDNLASMADKLGGEGLIAELCKGFSLLMDRDKGVITFESLRKNSAFLGLQDFRDDELRSMVEEGDLDGDGGIDQMEFCVLMFRLSPELMERSEAWLEHALYQEFVHHGKLTLLKAIDIYQNQTCNSNSYILSTIAC